MGDLVKILNEIRVYKGGNKIPFKLFKDNLYNELIKLDYIDEDDFSKLKKRLNESNYIEDVIDVITDFGFRYEDAWKICLRTTVEFKDI